MIQETGFPWDGGVRMRVEAVDEKPFPQGAFTLGVRIPAWSRIPVLSIMGEPANLDSLTVDGYARVTRTWQPGDYLDLDLDLRPVLVKAHPRVRANAGRVAVTFGPLAYCFEEVDNGDNLSALSIPVDAPLKATFEPDLLGGVVAIGLEGLRDRETDWSSQELYRTVSQAEPAFSREAVTLRAIPYYAWNNRGVGEMAVWLRAAE